MPRRREWPGTCVLIAKIEFFMHSLGIAVVIFIILTASALLGLRLGRRLPGHHQGSETKEAVRIGMGSVATMAALLLGLLVASTKSAYDTEKGEVIEMAAKLIFLDQVLRDFGAEADGCRKLVRESVESAVLRIWPAAESPTGTLAPGAVWSQSLPKCILGLDAKNDAQRAFKEQAAEVAFDLGKMRWMLFEQMESSISYPLLTIMVFWLALTFLSAGLFAPPNGTVITAQATAALAVAGAIFLILELDRPFEGFVRISSEPMLNALKQLML
jgi:hypothetical protein